MGLLEGKVAIVTGAGGGLGREHAHGTRQSLATRRLASVPFHAQDRID